MIQVSETTIRKESFCSCTEVPLVFQSLLAEAAKELRKLDLRPMYFQTYLAVPTRLSEEAISEICSHITQVAARFVRKEKCSYLGGEISAKRSSLDDDDRGELCGMIMEMTGG